MHVAWNLCILVLTQGIASADLWADLESASSGNLIAITKQYEKCLAEETASHPGDYWNDASKSRAVRCK